MHLPHMLLAYLDSLDEAFVKLFGIFHVHEAICQPWAVWYCFYHLYIIYLFLALLALARDSNIMPKSRKNSQPWLALDLGVNHCVSPENMSFEVILAIVPFQVEDCHYSIFLCFLKS